MDDVDRKIVSQLWIDGRTAYEDLAKQVGLTGVGVKKRVRKMLDQGLMRVSALMNVEKLNLSAALVLLETESGEAMREILQRFKDCPRVVQVFSTLGGYNLIALIVAENRGTLESISVEKCSLRSGQGIRRSEFYPVGKILYEPFLHVREHLTHRGRLTAPCNVDCRTCEGFQAARCVACPATQNYHGTL
ncbi:MAG: Lrp/AsnC family transcriptional regulator [Candidatus Bathyarchaeia archaeon]